ncbi:MAG: DDE-type integrase/transposase/recombinase [Nitrospira sp.]|nr:DDE-type integrase/transposase/recombinase [Nitrospira sp.]
MIPVTWQPGLTFFLYEIRYVILAKNSETSVLTQSPDGHHKVFQIRVLAEWLEKGDLVIEYEPVSDKGGKRPPLAALPEEGKKVARNRLRMIRSLCNLGALSTKMAEAAARAHNVSLRTIYRHRRAFRQKGFRGLVPGWKYSQTREPSFRNKAVQVIVDEFVTADFLTDTAPSISTAFQKVEAKCLVEGVRPPSRSAFFRYVDRLPKPVKTQTREGQQAHDNRYLATPNLFTKKTAKFPLYLVLIDHTVLDVEIVDEENRVAIGRPWLTLGFDAFSRMPWCMYLSFDHPSAVSLMMAFRHGVLLKNAVARYSTKYEWQAFGIPKTVIVDNGKEFHSNHFADLCALLHTTIVYRPRYTPRYGGLIERAFGSLDMRLIHSLVGNTKTMKDVRHKSHNPKDRARLTIGELHEILTVYFTDIYPHLRHRGLENRTPIQRWNEGLDLSGFPVSPSNVAEFLLELLPTDTRTMSRQGISYDNILYYHPGLAQFVRQELTIKWDPWDLSHLYVWLDKSQQWVETFCHEPDRMKMTSMEYRIVKALLTANDEPIDEQSVRNGWSRIQSLQLQAGQKKALFSQKKKRHGASADLNIGPRSSQLPRPSHSQGWDDDWDAPAVAGLPTF